MAVGGPSVNRNAGPVGCSARARETRSVSCQNFSTRRWISSHRWAGVGGEEPSATRRGEGGRTNKDPGGPSAGEPRRGRGFRLRPDVRVLVALHDRPLDEFDVGVGTEPDAVGF